MLKCHDIQRRRSPTALSIARNTVFVNKGVGLPKYPVEAVKWLCRAADQGNAKAQFNLGVCYTQGEGVPLDHAEAVKWFLKAADQKDAEAQYNLGVCYRDGQGVAKDEAEQLQSRLRPVGATLGASRNPRQR